jgi:hypothetical protein
MESPGTADLLQQRLRPLLTTALLIWGILLTVSIPCQRVHGDEAWLGEQAYFLRHDGIIRSELFRGYASQDERILVTHKLFILAGTAMVALFGWGLWPLRLLSLLAGVATILLLIGHVRRRGDPDTALQWRLAVIVLLASPLYFKFINLYRPEVMLAACGFLSFHCMTLVLQDHRRHYAFIAGAVAGVSVLVHLNGLMYIFAGLVVLLYVRQFRATGYFMASALALSALYFVDVIGHWDLFVRQLVCVPSLTAEDFRWDAPFWRLINEHKRLFRKPEIIFTSVLFFVSLFYHWCQAPRDRRYLPVYAVALIVALGAIGQAKTTPYAIALFPILALLIAESGWLWWQNRRRTRPIISWLVVAVWSVFVLHSLVADIVIATTGKRRVAIENRQIESYIETGTDVLAPIDFVFDEIDRYRVRALTAAELVITSVKSRPYDLDNLIAYANEQSIPAIVLDEENLARLRLEDVAVGWKKGDFEVVARLKDPERAVLKKTGATVRWTAY